MKLIHAISPVILACCLGTQVQAAAIVVPNGGFETLYKPGSTTITADTGGGWTQGVGPNADMESGLATYSDTTTGTRVDVPGWVNAPETGVPPNGGWTKSYDYWAKGSGTIDRMNPTPYGSYYFSSNGTDWGANGGAIQSATTLDTVGSGMNYTLSMSATIELTGPVLDLLSNGVIVTPGSYTTIADPLLAGWFVHTKTYHAGSLAGSVGQGLTIRVGWMVGASGTQAHLDNVKLDASVIPEPTTTMMGLLALGGLALVRRNRR